MKFFNGLRIGALALAITAISASNVSAQDKVGESPWGAGDELGRLNLMTDESRADLEDTHDKQGVSLQQGGVVLIRTGRMQEYENSEKYLENPPGLGMDGARFLVEDSGAMIIGADNLSLEAFPSEIEGNYIPVHTYLLAQHGVPILEIVNLEDIATDGVYEFAFIGGSIKLRGADAAPLRPIALPLIPGNAE